MGSEKFRSEKFIGVKKWLLLFLLFTIHYSLFTANAQTHLFGVGPAHLLDIYLSQEKFKGTGLTYLHIREPQIKEGKHWHNIIQHEIDLSKANDRSHSISMLEGDYNLYWGRYRRFAFSFTKLNDVNTARSQTDTKRRNRNIFQCLITIIRNLKSPFNF